MELTAETGTTSNLAMLPSPATRGLAGVMKELQSIIDGLPPLLQDAARGMLGKWLNGQADLDEVAATIEGMQQINTGSTPGTANRAA